jgi:predicted membrane channel-forming protein YqfA (hemolysin III family)
MLAGIVIAAIEVQRINSVVYFAAATVLIFVAAMLAGRKVQRNLKAKWIATIFAVSMVTFGLIWLLLSALNRKEAEPRTPPDYPAPNATP